MTEHQRIRFTLGHGENGGRAELTISEQAGGPESEMGIGIGKQGGQFRLGNGIDAGAQPQGAKFLCGGLGQLPGQCGTLIGLACGSTLLQHAARLAVEPIVLVSDGFGEFFPHSILPARP